MIRNLRGSEEGRVCQFPNDFRSNLEGKTDFERSEFGGGWDWGGGGVDELEMRGFARCRDGMGNSGGSAK